MSTTYNGWRALFSPPRTYFTAPNGKRVYCNNDDVATIFEYVARQWHERIEPLPPATYNIGDPKVRTGYIVIHSYRAPNTTIGTGNKSNHRSATGMDILGDKHPYEATNPPHLKGSGYRDGFTTRQRNELYKIQQEIGKARGRWVLRLGIDFAVGLRDSMHVEIAPGVTAQDVKATAARLRATEIVIDLTEIHRQLLDLGYTADESGVRSFQSDKADWGHNLTVDGVPGPATERALGDAMSRIDDIENKIDSLPQDVWGYRHPKYDNNRDAHGMLRDTRNGVRSTEGRVSDIVRSLTQLPAAIIAARVPFKEGTSLHRLFGKDFRFGALLGYAGASMVDRDSHTEEIVDALDADEIGPGTPHEGGPSTAAVEEQA